ncbi:AtzE family amidohydrolase [soil metagenome]
MQGWAAAIAEQVRNGERRAVDIVAATCETIVTRDAAINSFTAHTFERALREAEAVDAAHRLGQPLGPLAGVPYAVKNLFDVEGLTTLSGGRINAFNPNASADGVLVERMHAAGAVLVGALNMDEHAYGFTTENTHYGPTRNPHDTTRISGGSSGGSGAAVAARLVPITLGSDTNGSIRVPSSLCGVFGLKPTWGRLSRRGSYPFVHSLDHLGPFASGVDDLALAYDALQFTDVEDPACAQRPFEATTPFTAVPAGARVACLDGWFADWASPAAQRAVDRVARALGSTARVTFAAAERSRAAAFIITGAEGGSLHRQRLATHYDEYEPLSRDRLVAGSLIPSSWVVQAQKVRLAAYHDAMRLFDDWDLLIAPATPVSAPPIGTESLTINGKTVPARASMGILAQPLSCIGLPVCTVPLWPHDAGDADAHLPIGVQLIAPPWREDRCLAAARALEVAGVAQCREPRRTMDMA